MGVSIVETPTRLKLQGDVNELRLLKEKLRYRPANYIMSDAYQLYAQHQKRIKNAYSSGNLQLGQTLEKSHVGWDGYLHVVTIPVETPREGTVKRGHLAWILEVAKDADIKINSTELLPNPFVTLTDDDVPDDLLAVDLDASQWEIQKRCVLSWLQRGMARHMVTVSGGKTVMFCAAAAMVKRRFPNARFLYFTPTERLCKQVFAESQRFLPDWHITQFGGSGRDDTGADMVVATGAILGKRFREIVTSRWIKSFHTLLIDECQYAASPSWSKVILAASAYYRFSASDTIKEDDVHKNITLTGLCGPIIERVLPHELFDLDRIAVPTINIVENKDWNAKFRDLTHEPETETPAWVLVDGIFKKGTYLGPVFELDAAGEVRRTKKDAPIKVPGYHSILIEGRRFQVESRWCLLERKYDRAIISFKERNELIARWVRHYTNFGWPTLVVATRTLHVLILEAVIKKHVDPEKVRVLFGMHGADERDATFEWFKTTPGAVLISPLVKVGVSINELKALVVADYIADWEFAKQIIGRAIRRKLDGPNEAQVTWLVDVQHPSYRAGSRRVLAKLQTIKGFKFRKTLEPEDATQPELL